MTESDNTICGRVTPGSTLLDALLMLAEPEDRDGVRAAHGSIYELRGLAQRQCGTSTDTEAVEALVQRYEELKRVVTEKLISLLDREVLVLQCWPSLESEPYLLSGDKVSIVELDIKRSQIALPGSPPVNARVHPAELPPGLNEEEATKSTGVEGADEHASEQGRPKRGRPSRRREIEEAWARLHKKDAINFEAPQIHAIEAVRNEVVRASEHNDQSNLGTETIRRHISDSFRHEKARRARQ